MKKIFNKQSGFTLVEVMIAMAIIGILSVAVVSKVNAGSWFSAKPSGTDAQQAKQTEKLTAEANRRVGLPNLTKFTEKKMAKLIYELRDGTLPTYSYFMDMNGGLHFLCNSVGYGLPASVQYVSPKKLIMSDLGSYNGHQPMPQPEPNGLFMPEGLDATYVLCSGKKGKLQPVYSEPKLIVSPFPLHSKTNLKK